MSARIFGIPLRTARAAAFVFLITFVSLPIVGLPYTSDDTVNRNWPTQPFVDQISGAWHLNKVWMFEQGRFFPGGAVYALTMWNLLQTRAAYMTYLALLNILCIGLVAFIVWRITRSAHLMAFAGFATAMCFQLRWGFLDGIGSFGGLVLYTLVLTMITGLIAAHVLHGGSKWWVIAIAILWSLAITAYEVSLLMLPATLLLIWATGPSLRRNRARYAWATLPLIIPALLEMGITLYLRRHPLPLVPAYQTDLHGPVLSTFGKQFTAALPFMQEGFSGAQFQGRIALLLVVLLAVPTFLVWRPWSAGRFRLSTRVSTAMVAAGLWFWLVPSVLAGITVRWQKDLVWGQGDIYLAYSFVGVGMVLTGIAATIRTYAPRPWARVAFAVFFGLVLVACALAAGENILNVGTIVPGPASAG